MTAPSPRLPVELRLGVGTEMVSSLPAALAIVSAVGGPEGEGACCSSKGGCANMFAAEPLLSG